MEECGHVSTVLDLSFSLEGRVALDGRRCWYRRRYRKALSTKGARVAVVDVNSGEAMKQVAQLGDRCADAPALISPLP